MNLAVAFPKSSKRFENSLPPVYGFSEVFLFCAAHIGSGQSSCWVELYCITHKGMLKNKSTCLP